MPRRPAISLAAARRPLTAFAHVVGGVAHVERRATLAGDNVGGPGPHIQNSDGGDEAGDLSRLLFNGHGPFRGGRQRVAPQRHRCGAGVASGPGKNKLHARLSSDCLHDAQRTLQPFQYRPLLDMDLEIAEDAALERGCGNIAGVQPIF